MRWRFCSPLVCGGAGSIPSALLLLVGGGVVWAGRAVCVSVSPYRALRPAVGCGFAGATVSSLLSVRVGLFYGPISLYTLSVRVHRSGACSV